MEQSDLGVFSRCIAPQRAKKRRSHNKPLKMIIENRNHRWCLLSLRKSYADDLARLSDVMSFHSAVAMAENWAATWVWVQLPVITQSTSSDTVIRIVITCMNNKLFSNFSLHFGGWEKLQLFCGKFLRLQNCWPDDPTKKNWWGN